MHVPVNRVFNNVARNLGLSEWTTNIDSWAEWAYEAEQYIGSNKTFLQTDAVYSRNPATAEATLSFTDNDIEKEYIEINGTRFIFRDTSLSSFINTFDAEYIVNIGANLDTTLGNLVDTVKNSGFETVKGIRVDHNTGDKTVTLVYGRNGYKGNSTTLDTSSRIRVTKHFTGGKSILQNKQITLPANMVKLLSVRVGDSIISPTSSQYKSKLSNQIDRYYINGNRLNFSKDYNTDVTISYLSVPLSPEGYPMILQGHEEAVAFYIMWKHKSIGYYSGKVPQYIVKDLERRWYQLCGKARGDDNMPTSIELLKIGKIWNTKIPHTSGNPPLYDGLNSY